MDKTQQQNRLGYESIPKLLMNLTIPTILAQIVNVLYSVVDRMYITNIPVIGATALTGVGLTFPVIIIISAFASLIGRGGAPLVSIALGEGDNKKATRILANCFFLLIMVSVILTVLLSFTNKPIIKLFGSSDDTLPYALEYISIYIFGTISVQLTLGLNPFLTAQGYAKFTMVTVFIGAITNIILDPIFIFGLNMGVKGAALATVIAQSCSATFVVLFLFSKKPIVSIKLSQISLFTQETIRVFSLGISPFVMEATGSMLQIAFTINLKEFGSDAHVGALIILNSVMQVFSIPLNGFSQGAQPLIGYNFGAKNFDRVKLTVKYLVIVSLIGSMLTTIFGVFFPELMCGIFAKDPQQLAITIHASRLFFAGFFIFGLQSAFQCTFVAFGQAKVSIFIAVLRKIILLIPLIILIPRLTNLGTDGIFLAESISDFISASTATICYIFISKKLLKDDTLQKA